jgi:hypothetical protein
MPIVHNNAQTATTAAPVYSKPRFTAAEEAEIVKEAKKEFSPVTFYCTRGELSFALPQYERDGYGEIIKENGRSKRLIVKDNDGNNGHQVFESFKFDRLPIKDPKSGKTSAMIFTGIFVISPEYVLRWARKEELVEYLTLLSKNKHSFILTEDEYKLQRNPDAFAAEKEVMTLKLSNEELKRRNEKLEATLREKEISIE